MSGIVTDEPRKIIELLRGLDIRLWHFALCQVLIDLLDAQHDVDPDYFLRGIHDDVCLELERRADELPLDDC